MCYILFLKLLNSFFTKLFFMIATVVHLLYRMVLSNKSSSARPGITIYGNICALVKLTFLNIFWGFSIVFFVYSKYYLHFGCQF